MKRKRSNASGDRPRKGLRIDRPRRREQAAPQLDDLFDELDVPQVESAPADERTADRRTGC